MGSSSSSSLAFLAAVVLACLAAANSQATVSIFTDERCHIATVISTQTITYSSCVQPDPSSEFWFQMADTHCADGVTPAVDVYTDAACTKQYTWIYEKERWDPALPPPRRVVEMQQSQISEEKLIGRRMTTPFPGCRGWTGWNGFNGYATYIQLSKCPRDLCTACKCECSKQGNLETMVDAGEFESLSPGGYCDTMACKKKFTELCPDSGGRTTPYAAGVTVPLVITTSYGTRPCD